MNGLPQKIERAHQIINFALSKSKKPFVAFSGGKDGLVVAHMVTRHLPNIKMACETSHTFDVILKDIREIAEMYKFNVEYFNSCSDEWLIRHPEYIFASETKYISRYCSQRQQKMLKKFQSENGYDCTFTGRTNFDNKVKAEVYDTKKNKLQAHPIRDFTERDVFNYLSLYGIRVPMVYSTKFGERTGNAPFYAMGYKNKGCPISKIWEAVNELDPERKFYKKFHKVVTKKFA